jgi:hypothetical protein
MLVRTIQSSRRTRSFAPAINPNAARTQHGSWPQQPAANTWAAPQAASTGPWVAPPVLAPTYEALPSQVPDQPNKLTEFERGGVGRHRDPSESP